MIITITDIALRPKNMYLEWTPDTYLEQWRKGKWMILDWSVEKADDI